MRGTRADWIVVVPPTDRVTAEQAFARWRRENPAWSATLIDADVAVDTIRAADHRTLTRYRVRGPRP